MIVFCPRWSTTAAGKEWAFKWAQPCESTWLIQSDTQVTSEGVTDHAVTSWYLRLLWQWTIRGNTGDKFSLWKHLFSCRVITLPWTEWTDLYLEWVCHYDHQETKKPISGMQRSKLVLLSFYVVFKLQAYLCSWVCRHKKQKMRH